MSIKRDESGRRWVEVEVEVPGTPEEVWTAIATGRGISSWFVPTEVEERVGGESKASFGPGMDSVSTITAWDPPNRLAADSQDLGPEAPNIATEWIVEAKSGGTCTVRVVHSLFTDADDWDGELEGWAGGWPDFFRILRLYLEHYRGEFGTLLQFSAQTELPPPDAWKRFCAAIGLTGVVAGDERKIEVEGLPAFDVWVERAGRTHHEGELLLRTGSPMPGLAHAFAMPMGPATFVSLRFFLYGDAAQDAQERFGPAWTDWLAGEFAEES